MKNMFIISPSYNTSNKEENPAKYSHEPKYSISNLLKRLLVKLTSKTLLKRWCRVVGRMVDSEENVRKMPDIRLNVEDKQNVRKVDNNYVGYHHHH